MRNLIFWLFACMNGMNLEIVSFNRHEKLSKTNLRGEMEIETQFAGECLISQRFILFLSTPPTRIEIIRKHRLVPLHSHSNFFLSLINGSPVGKLNSK